jgi:DNA-binding MarR family transcriptional regulator
MSAVTWYREVLIATLLRTSIKLQNHLDQRFRPLGMTAQEASVLLTAVEARRITPGGLAHCLGRDKGKVTRFIQRLVARNLMRRRVKAQDRRVAELEPTSRGRAIAPRLRVVFDEIRDDLFREVRTESVERVGDVLIAMLANMDNGMPRRKEKREQLAVPAESGSSKLGSNAHASEHRVQSGCGLSSICCCRGVAG